MHILYTALYTFPKVLTKRICFDVNESDPRSNVHYLGSSENKAWKKKKKKIQACTGLEPMNSAIPEQRSTNWANKPTGSWF